jgi:glutamine synthetase type III
MSIEAMKLALEALGWTDEWRPQGLKERAIAALRTAIAAAKGEA